LSLGRRGEEKKRGEGGKLDHWAKGETWLVSPTKRKKRERDTEDPLISLHSWQQKKKKKEKKGETDACGRFNGAWAEKRKKKRGGRVSRAAAEKKKEKKEIKRKREIGVD